MTREAWHRRWLLSATALFMVTSILISCTTGTASPRVKRSLATAHRADQIPRLNRHQIDHQVGVAFEYKSFRITVGHAVYDSKRRRLDVGLRFENISGSWAQSEVAATLDAGGTETTFTGTAFDVPPGASVRSTATAQDIARDPIKHGRIIWGSDSSDQPVIALDGRHHSNVWMPTDVHVDGWAQIGRFAVHVTGVEVHEGQLDQGLAAEPQHRILRVLYDEYTARGTTSPFDPNSNLLLKLPDGSMVDAVGGGASGAQLSWTMRPGGYAEFPVPSKLTGAYQVLLASMPKSGFGVMRPELIERRPVPFSIRAVEPPTSRVTRRLPFPDLVDPWEMPKSKSFDERLEVGAVNVPGFEVRPTRLRYDGQARTATLDAMVTSIQTESNPDDGPLDSAASFSLPVILTSRGRTFDGFVDGDGQIDATRPTRVTFEFSSVLDLVPDDAGMFIGPHTGATSSLPLGADSLVPQYPPTRVGGTITSPKVVAENWSVQPVSYRIGLFNASVVPEMGKRDLELVLKVTASASSNVRATGLFFDPEFQVLIAGTSGYDVAAVADSGLVEFEPGQTKTVTVTFDVPETFTGGRLPIVVRSRAEVGDFIDTWVETRFETQLTPGESSAVAPSSGGIS